MKHCTVGSLLLSWRINLLFLLGIDYDECYVIFVQTIESLLAILAKNTYEKGYLERPH